MIEVRVEKCSFNPETRKRITTFVCKYPFIIHGEVLTHRAFSRNAQSKRAIPVKKFVEQTREQMFVPDAFTRNCKGMSAKEVLSDTVTDNAQKTWKSAGALMCQHALELSSFEAHKEYANRVLEPFSHMTVIITATELANFFELRNHPHAHPEIKKLAAAMQKAWASAKPEICKTGDWHIPFDPGMDFTLPQRLEIATARNARVTHLTHEGRIDTEADLDLFVRLRDHKPMHPSPFEHCAEALATRERSGNFVGYRQYRKMFPNECAEEYTFTEDGMLTVESLNRLNKEN